MDNILAENDYLFSVSTYVFLTVYLTEQQLYIQANNMLYHKCAFIIDQLELATNAHLIFVLLGIFLQLSPG